jgi:asparagine synthase (glutamine-hydrolysing)
MRHDGRPPWTKLAALRPEFATAIRLDERLLEAGDDGLYKFGTDCRATIAHFLHARRSQPLWNAAATGLHYGLEFRNPLIDRELVDFCLAIPREQFLQGGRSRSLARRVLADRLPPSVIEETSRGAQRPEWFARLTPQRGELVAEVERLHKVPLAAEMLDLPRLRAMLDDWPADAAAAQSMRFPLADMLTRAIQVGRFLRWVDGGNE